jgi:hypothetical protein
MRASADNGELSGLRLLTWVYRPGLVDRVVAACGRGEQRRRLLPARLVVYLVLAVVLFPPAPYLEVMRHLVEGLRGEGLLGEWHIPAKSSLFRARQRLGTEPLRVLFATTVRPMGTEATPGCFWRGLRLLGRRRQPGERGRLRPSRKQPRSRQVQLSPGADSLFGRGGHPPHPGCRAGRLPHRGSHAGPEGRRPHCGATKKTSDAVIPSSGHGQNWGLRGREGGGLVVGNVVGEAMVEAAEQAVEEVALGRGVPFAGFASAVVVGSRAG